MQIHALIHNTLLRLCGVVVLLICSACEPSLPSPPVSQVLGLGKGDESVEFDFQVQDVHGYSVNLDIYFHDPADRDERRQLIAQLGNDIFSDGSIDAEGVPMALRVRVKTLQAEGPAVDFDQTTDRTGFVAASKQYATKRVLIINNQFPPTDRKLQRGTYRIRVDNLHPVPELADRMVKLTLTYAEQGK